MKNLSTHLDPSFSTKQKRTLVRVLQSGFNVTKKIS
nr:MAG TPA: hypothetical protein [Caudoviricetes sp.]